MSVFEWKELFGVADKYPKVAEFRRRVLDPAIEQINAQGEFLLKLEPIKSGRFISHFSISIFMKKKAIENADNAKSHKPFTHAQAEKFAKLLANDSNFGSKFARSGESMSEFSARLSQDLQRDSQKVSDYMPYLTRLGFK